MKKSRISQKLLPVEGLQRRTKRLVLRPLEPFDHENWVQAYSTMAAPQNEWDETNWDERELGKIQFRELLQSQLSDRRRDHNYVWGVFRKDDGLLIGEVALMDVSRGVFQNAYLGYRIFNQYWGEGYATEACEAVLLLAFKKLKLHRVEAGIAPENKRSLRVAKRLGLRREGLSRRRLFINKIWRDMLIYALTREDFISATQPRV